MFRDILNIVSSICLLLAIILAALEGDKDLIMLTFIALILTQIEDKLYQILQRLK